MTKQILLTGGKIVTTESVQHADILIEGETIIAVGPHIDAPSTVQRVDISGLTVLPGLIDAHVHLREPGGTHKEDFTTGTQAALAGGVTTVLAMPNTSPPTGTRQTLEQTLALADSKIVCDVGFYIGATPENATEAAALVDRAIAMKMYVGSSTGSLLVDQFPAQIEHFETFPVDRIIAVHAEDEAAVQYYADRGQHRPDICAALATAHVIALAEQTNRRLHICHVSTPYELQLIEAARQRGAAVTCEVCPHHLFMDTGDAERLGAYGKVNPPLRAPDAVAGLWDYLPAVDLIATDHAPHTRAEKDGPSPPSGMPGLETLLPLLLTAADAGRLSLPDIARLAAASPAAVFGLLHKGHISPGYHADLTVVDLNEAWTLTNDELFTRCGWSPWEEHTFHGRVKQTYLRGRLAFDNGKILVESGFGQPVFPA